MLENFPLYSFWFILFCILMISELFTNILVCFILSISSLIICIIAFFCPNNLSFFIVELFLFSIFSLTIIYFSRHKLKSLVSKKNFDTSLDNDMVICLTDFNESNNFTGKVEYKGSSWNAQTDKVILKKGEQAQIIKNNNLKLIIGTKNA